MNERQPKFTPGPWVVSSDNGWNSVRANSHCGPKVCGPQGMNNESNWDLIAAAPEMYDLLAEVEPHLDEWNFPITLKDRIEALLNKIDGGPE